MRRTSSIICILLIILPLIYSNIDTTRAADNDLPILEAELTILDDVDLIEFGEESIIGLEFKQSGFNWTKLSDTGRFWRDFLFAKIYLPIIFNSIIYLLGYNSVVFEAEVVGNPPGWEAWISPSSVTYFTGNSTAEVDLHVKVSRPTSPNTATIRIKYTAYSGGSNIMGTASTDVIASIKQYHLAEINAKIQHKEAVPDTVVYFPIQVTNRGNYEDTFEFDVTNQSNGFLGLVSGQLTLKPGQTGEVQAMVLTPYVYLYDYGTQISLNISAYSVYEPSKKFQASISVTSRGFLISELFLLTITIIAFIILFMYILFYFFIEDRKVRIYGKPDKPWKIPSEEKYLKEIREKDRKEYDKIKNMMRDEYQSSLLWYNDYIKNKKIKEKKIEIKKQSDGVINKDILKNFFNSSNKKNKIKTNENKTLKNNKKISEENNENYNQSIKEKSKNRKFLIKIQKDIKDSLKRFFKVTNKNKISTEEDLKIKKISFSKRVFSNKLSQKNKKEDRLEKNKMKSIKKIKRNEEKQKKKISV